MIKRAYFCVLCLLFIITELLNAQIDLSKSLISNGGGESMTDLYLSQISMGQPAIGLTSGNSVLAEIGFWNMTVLQVEELESFIPATTREENKKTFLSQNYPNPFNERTFFDFYIPVKEDVRITLYTNDGKSLGVLLRRTMDPGNYTIEWSGKSLPDGRYICELVAGEERISKAVLVVR